MRVKKAILKTKVFLHKTVQNFSSFLNREHQKLHKSSSLNLNHPNLSQYSDDFSKQSKSTTTSTNETADEKNVQFESFENGCYQTITKNKPEEREIKREKKAGSCRENKGDPCSKIAREGGYILARKMKELEMMETSDVDQVLDIEEVLHYYSCLTSPCYLDIVDKFYIDMHSEFLLPQPSKSISNSSRRLAPLNLGATIKERK